LSNNYFINFEIKVSQNFKQLEVNMKRVIFILALLSMIITLNTAHAQPQMPKLLNYQGTLVDSNQDPVPNGGYEITFKLYDESNSVIWTEVHDPVDVYRGMFHVVLGTNTPLSMPFNEQYELGIQVNNDPELQPHIPLTGAAYAMRADDSDKLLGFSVKPTPTPNMLLPLDSNGKFPASVLSGSASGNYLKKNESDNSTATSTDPILTIKNEGDSHGIVSDTKSSQTNHYGVLGRNYGNGPGIRGFSEKSHGIIGVTESTQTDDYGVYGKNDGNGTGVRGYSVKGPGVSGKSENRTGVYGTTSNVGYFGVYGYNENGIGVKGHSGSNTGIAAYNNSNNHAALLADNQGNGTAIFAYTEGKIAAVFRGNVQIQKKGGAVLIELGEGLDYAEGFDVSDNQKIDPGTVLIIDEKNPGKLTKSKNPYDTKVAGIVAGAKGLGSGVRLGPDMFDFDVALAGRVYCNVDGSYGAISPGDLLTTSPTPGYAMIVKDHKKAQGAIIGKAMETLKECEKGQILVLVTLQ
jgi:hypothetical protein